MTRGKPSDFWSRRKARVAEAERAEVAARTDLTEAEDHARIEALPDDEALAELNLPDPDTLKMGDDFTGFMRRAVPERLRRRALRQLWTSNPVLACVDGLNDYDDDYRIVEVSGADMKTAYQVGRGFVQKVLEPEPDTPKADDLQPDDATETPEDALVHAPEATQEPAQVSDTRHTHVIHESDTPEPAFVAPRRRMRFAFEDAQGPNPQDTTT
ncbi:DUF3306 domain-containing protein [Rhodobacteraceae bacterium SC52]|nr:DUF3306 domain-containing protein [Rhodobacteraceae bacterium SC52]